MVNFFLVSLHLEGKLPPNDELIKTFGGSLIILRKGEVLRNGKINPEDRAFLRLAQWEVELLDEYEEGNKRFEEIATVLRALTPALQSLKDAEITKGLRLGTVRRTDQGGISFPSELVQVLAEAGLSLHISMTVILDDDDGDDIDDEPLDDNPGSDQHTTVLVS